MTNQKSLAVKYLRFILVFGPKSWKSKEKRRIVELRKKKERERVQTRGNNSERISYILTHTNRMESALHIDSGVYS